MHSFWYFDRLNCEKFNLKFVEEIGSPDYVHELLLLVGADGVDLLALSSTNLAANVGSQVELDGRSGEVQLTGLAEQSSDDLLILGEGVLGVEDADQLLGAVIPVVVGSLEHDLFDIFDRSAITTTAVTSTATSTTTAQSSSNEETASDGGTTENLQAQQTEGGSTDNESAGEDGFAAGDEHGGRDGDEKKFGLMHSEEIKC